MYKAVAAVEVRLWGRRVGAVALDPRLGYYAFEYDPGFVTQGIEVAPLTMPLAQARDPFVFADLPTPTFKRLPALLADALPDDFGNALIDAWMANKGITKTAITPLDRLAYMGRRGMGALEFRPSRGPNVTSHTAIKLGRLVETARQTAQGRLYRGEGLMSIARAFLYAGAGSVVATRWNADDAETPVLIGHFVKNLCAGMRRSAALTKARYDFMQTRQGSGHPYYWAGLMLTGERGVIQDLNGRSFGYWWWSGGAILGGFL